MVVGSVEDEFKMIISYHVKSSFEYFDDGWFITGNDV